MRKVLFWLHLTAGCVAGVVILIMSLTGVLLAFERQINTWADRQYRSSPGEQRFALETIEGATNVTLSSDRAAPVAVSYGREKLVYLDRASGRVLGEGSTATRAFFAKIESVHRALGMPMRGGLGRPTTGACNLIFLGLIVSGVYLWIPRRLDWKGLRPSIWFRGGLRGKARDWNWHNTIGFWSAVPLFFIVLSSVIMSYPWANNLLYTLTRTTPPPAQAPGGQQAPGRRERSRNADRPAVAGALTANKLVELAGSRFPGWQTISFRLPDPSERVITMNVDSGNGGQPQRRVQLLLDRTTGAVERRDDFTSNNAGRRLRIIARFLHTGEILGMPTQIVAALASLGGVVLVWTGISLAVRRAAGFVKRAESRGAVKAAV